MKKIIATFIAGSMIFGLTACDKKEWTKAIADTTAETTDQTPVTENTTESATDTTAVTTTEESTEETYPPTWFEEQGLTITPQGNFTLKTELFNVHGEHICDIEVPSTATITETTEGVEDGYKKVIAVFTNDYSAIDAQYGNTYNGSIAITDSDGFEDIINHGTGTMAFDRYSGASFENNSSAPAGDSHGGAMISVEYEGKTYELTFNFEYTYEYDNDNCIGTSTYTVVCPVEYDGVVFQQGYLSYDLWQKNYEFDDSKLYTMDQYPSFANNGYPYVYFSYSNE